MAHIKDLPLHMLQKVFAYFYFGFNGIYLIDEFRRLLPPAAVCRVWREFMLRYIYHTAYLECHMKDANENSKATQPEYEWKSNIGLIASQRLSSAVRRLRIQPFGCSLNFADIIRGLDTFCFSSRYWRSVNALELVTNHSTVAVDDNTTTLSDDEALATQLTEYLDLHVPNIGNLWIHAEPQSNVTQLLSNKLVSLYIGQLHALYCYPTPITFNRYSFSSRLRRLAVGIAARVKNRLPDLLASPLETLYLFNIPHNFAWWTFAGITPRYIEFTKLCELRLEFRQPPEGENELDEFGRQVSVSTVSFDTGYRRLFFPTLKRLSIYNSPYSDCGFYSVFIHSPLRSVSISGSLKSVQHLDHRILLNASKIDFTIDKVMQGDNGDFAQFYHKLFSSLSNAKTAELTMRQSSVPLPILNTIEWTNLEDLTLRANAYLLSVIQIITQLPKLYKLEVENVIDELDDAGVNLQELLKGRLARVPTITTNLKELWIYTNVTSSLVFSLDVVCYLTILIQSLDEVVVPGIFVLDMEKILNRYAHSFPHLYDIKVFSREEQNYW